MKRPDENLDQGIRKKVLWVDSGFCAIFINTDPKRHCRLTLTYKNPQNLVILNGQGNCITLFLKPSGGKGVVFMRKLEPHLEDSVSDYSYLIKWEMSEMRVSKNLAQIFESVWPQHQV